MDLELKTFERVGCGCCGWQGPECDVVMPADCRESDGCCPICESDDLGAIPIETSMALVKGGVQ